MLETGVPVEKDETGAIFVDRDPKHFRLILNYMRDGSVEIPDSKVDIQEIQVEAQYYLLDGLVKLCNSQKSITYEKKDRCLETAKDVMNAVFNSTKKAVILVPYGTGTIYEATSVFRDSAFVVKYSADFDIYFFKQEPDCKHCRVCDKVTGGCTDIIRHHFDEFMKDTYGVK